MRQLLRVIPGFFHRLLSPAFGDSDIQSPLENHEPEPDPDYDPDFLDGKGPRHLALVLRHLTRHPPLPGTTLLLLPVLRCRLSDLPLPDTANH